MRNMGVSSAIVRLALPFCLLAASAQGATYYVSLAGDDANAGASPKLAWRTITHAARTARAGGLNVWQGDALIQNFQDLTSLASSRICFAKKETER